MKRFYSGISFHNVKTNINKVIFDELKISPFSFKEIKVYTRTPCGFDIKEEMPCLAILALYILRKSSKLK